MGFELLAHAALECRGAPGAFPPGLFVGKSEAHEDHMRLLSPGMDWTRLYSKAAFTSGEKGTWPRSKVALTSRAGGAGCGPAGVSLSANPRHTTTCNLRHRG